MATDHGYNLPNMTIADFIRFTQSLSAANCHFLSEVMLLIPPANVVPERSFYRLKRLKTYLRSTIGDDRLFHRHVDQQLADSLDFIQAAN